MTDLSSREDLRYSLIPRRAILRTTAWTLPAVLASATVPAASASDTLSLSFRLSSYTGTACTTLSAVTVTAVDHGVAKQSAVVTVSLGGGCTFVGGSASFSGPTDDHGQLVLPGVLIPYKGANVTIVAESGSAKATATLTADAAPPVVTYFNYDNRAGIPNTLSILDVATCWNAGGGHRAIALASDGSTWLSTDGSTFVEDITDVKQILGGSSTIVYVHTDNSVSYTGFYRVYTGLPWYTRIVGIATYRDDRTRVLILLEDGTTYMSYNGEQFEIANGSVTHISGADRAFVVSFTTNKVSYAQYDNVIGVPTPSPIIEVATCSDGGNGHWAMALTASGQTYLSHNGSDFSPSTSNASHIAGADAALAVATTDNKVTYYSYSGVGGIPTSSPIVQVATCSDGTGGHWAGALTADGTAWKSLNGAPFVVWTTNVTHIAGTDAVLIASRRATC